jgi:hypothetical protein
VDGGVDLPISRARQAMSCTIGWPVTADRSRGDAHRSGQGSGGGVIDEQ